MLYQRFAWHVAQNSCDQVAVRDKGNFYVQIPFIRQIRFSTYRAACSRSSSVFSRLAKDSDLRDESLLAKELTRTALRHRLFPCGVLRRRFVGATFSLFGVDKLFCTSSDDLTSPYMCPRLLTLRAHLLQTLLEYLEGAFGT